MSADALCNVPLTAEQIDNSNENFALVERTLNAHRPANAEPIDPIFSYIFLFLAVPDPYIERRVERLYKRRARKPTNTLRPGYVYVFWDRRDAPNIVKIGSTEHTPNLRLASWRNELGASFNDIVLLFAFPANSALFSEYVLHEVLRCERIVNRVNRRTGSGLIEYFLIDDIRALRNLCRLTLRHTNWFTAKILHAASHD